MKRANIGDSYSTGAVSGGPKSTVGSFAGYGLHLAKVATSYATGLVSAGGFVGGFIGHAASTNTFTDAYWDTDSTGVTSLSQGAGNIPNFPGITGLSTKQLQSGLPAGFNPAVWAEDPNINGGLPYLLTNHPGRSIR